MTKDEVLNLALEALEDLGMKHFENTGEVLYKETFTTIKEALAQPEQEPVAWRLKSDAFDYGVTSYDKEQVDMHIECGWRLIDVLYTTPPQRPSRSDIKPLTDEEIHRLDPLPHAMFDQQRIDFARAIEAAHGIKGEA